MAREKRTFYDCPPSRNRPRCSSSKSACPNPSRRKDPKTRSRLHSPRDGYHLNFPLPSPTNRIRYFSSFPLLSPIPPSPFPLPPRLDSRGCQRLLQNFENLNLLRIRAFYICRVSFCLSTVMERVYVTQKAFTKIVIISYCYITKKKRQI